jgi:hypothetical protein
MPTLSPLISESGLAIVSSAVLFALLDELVDKGVLERQEIRSVLKTAKSGVCERSKCFHGPEAAELMKSLCRHFADPPHAPSAIERAS